jgi:hypothetical protein
MNEVRQTFLDTIPVAHAVITSPEVAGRWDAASALPELSVRGLAGHLARGVFTVETYLNAPIPTGGGSPSAQYGLDKEFGGMRHGGRVARESASRCQFLPVAPVSADSDPSLTKPYWSEAASSPSNGCTRHMYFQAADLMVSATPAASSSYNPDCSRSWSITVLSSGPSPGGCDARALASCVLERVPLGRGRSSSPARRHGARRLPGAGSGAA